MRKVAINCRYGGFGLSGPAIKMLHEIKHPEDKCVYYTKFYGDKCYRKLDESEIDNPELPIYVAVKDCGQNPTDIEDSLIYDDEYESRHDPDLIKVIETLGVRANGDYARLEIVEIDDDDMYIVDDYDGYETLMLRNSVDNWDWQ